MKEEEFFKQPTEIKGFEEFSEETLPISIGGYKIESLLSKGGMSLLYLGIHPETSEPIAIKVLTSALASHPEMVERFMREAEIIELTNHPNIVKLYGHGRWEGGVYIAMEFIQGISLRQMILQQSLSLKRSLEIILQIAHALTHLHSHGIIHRDLKPENILLTAQGGVKVIDFGIAGLYTEIAQEEKRRIMGTPVYMSPEQRQDPLNVSFSTDIFSLGIITYEVVLGRLSHGVIHLSQVPKGLQKIISKALQPEAKNRYEDIVDFVQDLAAYLNSDELKKDMRGSDYLGEMSESLKEAQLKLIPASLPQWPRIETVLASNKSSALSTFYYDFFTPSPQKYCVVLAESLSTGVEGLLQIAILRGMIRALAPQVTNALEFIKILNQRIIEEDRDLSFSLAYLTLIPSEERLTFVSCGLVPLWHIPNGFDVPRRLSSENIALGIVEHLDPIEIESNLNPGDTVILHSFQAMLAKSASDFEQNEELFLKALKENIFLSPQKMLDAVFRKITASDEKSQLSRPVTLIGMTRTI